MRSRIAACRSETGYVIIAVLTVLVVITTAAGLGLHRLAGLRRRMIRTMFSPFSFVLQYRPALYCGNQNRLPYPFSPVP